jgi:hypothetical protein
VRDRVLTSVSFDATEAALSGRGVRVFAVQAFRVPWSSASFLAYVGGLTILGAAASLLNAQADEQGSVGLAGWALIVFVSVTLVALGARGRGHRITAGLLAVSSVASFVVLLGALLDWFGWLASLTESPFHGFRVSVLFLEVAAVVAALVAMRVFEFPLLVLVVAAGTWLFVTDLLSSGGDWSAVVTLLVGLALLAAAVAVDFGDARPYGFWLHVVAGLTIGGGLLWFFHDGDWDWILVAIAGLLYIAVGDRLVRSSWVVLGAWGILQTAAHFAAKWSSDIYTFSLSAFYFFPFVLADAFDDSGESRASHPWAAALVFALAGALFVLIALAIARRRREAVPGAGVL